jgi:hypothetical protein
MTRQHHLRYDVLLARPTCTAYLAGRLPRRCPGCDAAASAARHPFLSSMAATLKAAAPSQLQLTCQLRATLNATSVLQVSRL